MKSKVASQPGIQRLWRTRGASTEIVFLASESSGAVCGECKLPLVGVRVALRLAKLFLSRYALGNCPPCVSNARVRFPCANDPTNAIYGLRIGAKRIGLRCRIDLRYDDRADRDGEQCVSCFDHTRDLRVCGRKNPCKPLVDNRERPILSPYGAYFDVHSCH